MKKMSSGSNFHEMLLNTRLNFESGVQKKDVRRSFVLLARLSPIMLDLLVNSIRTIWKRFDVNIAKMLLRSLKVILKMLFAIRMIANNKLTCFVSSNMNVDMDVKGLKEKNNVCHVLIENALRNISWLMIKVKMIYARFVSWRV